MPGAKDQGSSEAAQTQRIDKWLWFARVAKTRTLAASLVETGKIRVNKVKISKPSHNVREGDVITATVARRVRVFRVLSSGVRRGPATEARTLFEELTPAPDPLISQRPKRAHLNEDIRQTPTSAANTQQIGQREAGSGRPTKRERRQIDKLRSNRG